MIEVKIKGQSIKLDQFLKFAGIVQTGGQAKIIIREEMVKLNNEIVVQRGKKLYNKDFIEVEGSKYLIVAEEI